MTNDAYLDLILGLLEKIKEDIILPNVEASRVITRYITSEGVDDEGWLAHLKDDDGKVDIFLLTFNLIVGKDERSRLEDPTGTFEKPISVTIDYFYDYTQGMAVDNSEKRFLSNVLVVDNALENKRGCLDSKIQIDGWTFRLKIKRFANASTHWMSGVINLKLQDLFL